MVLEQGLDYRYVHYAEKRAEMGHTRDEIMGALRRVHDEKTAQRHADHVHNKRVPIEWHGALTQLLYFGVGLSVMMVSMYSLIMGV